MKKYKSHLYLTLIVTLICLLLAIIFQFIPFGKESLLTIDLGQQYIDFFAYFKSSLNSLQSLPVYSLQKGIGGETIGLWTYYLLSPFNLIFLFFKKNSLDLAISLITYLKLLAMANSFLSYCNQKYKLKSLTGIVFSLAYTFMSYTLVYLLNLMWLDGLIWLPIIALGLHRLITKDQFLLYSLSLAAMMISNYYIAYMISIFLVFYAAFNIIEVIHPLTVKIFLKKYGKFILASLTATLIASITLIPSFISLLGNKVAQMDGQFSLNRVYNFQDIFSKIFIGSFNFNEISSGSANIYSSLFILILLVIYFFNKRIQWREKIAAGMILLFFMASFQFEFLDLFWHGGKFPIWYDGRFSFLFVFFCINLAMRSYIYRPLKILTWHYLSILTFFASIVLFYLWIETYDYLNPLKLLISLIFIFGYILIMQMTLELSTRHSLLIMLLGLEVSINGIMIISQFSYVDHSRFQDYVNLLDEIIEPIQNTDSFYRIHKSFNRTKNEAFYGQYMGLDHFSSTLEDNTIRLYGYLGQADGSGFVTYSHGSIFLDDFFGVRYLVDLSQEANDNLDQGDYQLSRSASDLDMEYYPIIHKDTRYQIYENTDAFSLAFEVSKDIEEESFYAHQPIYNQNLLIDLMDYRNILTENIFTHKEFKQTGYHLVDITNMSGETYYTYKNRAYENEANPGLAYIEKNFTPETNDPYYLTLPSQYSNKIVALSLNDQELTFYSPYLSRQIYPIAINNQAEDFSFKTQLLTEELIANQVMLYQFNLQAYENFVANYSSNQFKLNELNGNTIEGTIDIEQDDANLLFTLPYDSGWQIWVGEKPVQAKAVLNKTMLAVPVKRGKHQIKMIYQPDSLKYGVLFSLLGILVLFGLQYKQKQPAK